MREIKFRAWDLEDKYMFFVDRLDFGYFGRLLGDPAKFSVYEYNEEDSRADGNYLVLHNGDALELMQYTGLKDKNGKEIYEGDIIKTGEGNKEVKWIDARWGFENVMWAENNVIIGNIYENSTQLKNACPDDYNNPQLEEKKK